MAIKVGTTSLITFAEFEQMPDAPGKQELLDGELIELPPPKYIHTRLAQRVYDLLRSSPLGERAILEAGYRIGGGWLQPDVSVMHTGQELVSGYLAGSPALAVEILSPSNRASEIERKLDLYFAEGTDEVWVIDSCKRTMMVYSSSSEGVTWKVVKSHHESPLKVTVILNTLFAPGS